LGLRSVPTRRRREREPGFRAGFATTLFQVSANRARCCRVGSRSPPSERGRTGGGQPRARTEGRTRVANASARDGRRSQVLRGHAGLEDHLRMDTRSHTFPDAGRPIPDAGVHPHRRLEARVGYGRAHQGAGSG
jgi:hypothetical protein